MEIGHADEKFRAQGHPTEWSLTGLRRDRRSDRGKCIIKMIQDSFQIVRETYTAASLVESGRKREDSGDEITINLLSIYYQSKVLVWESDALKCFCAKLEIKKTKMSARRMANGQTRRLFTRRCSCSLYAASPLLLKKNRRGTLPFIFLRKCAEIGLRG